MDYAEYATRARAALIMAAMRRSIVTYKELATTIDLPPHLPLPHHINRVLRLVAEDCISRGEPSLAVIVVANALPASQAQASSLERASKAL
jgi:hypothetical protein